MKVRLRKWKLLVFNVYFLAKLKKTEKHLGKLGLVDQVIERLQNYFGMAVRSIVGDIVKMKKSYLRCTVSRALFKKT